MFRNPVTDLIVALVVVLLIFGPKRLPMLGRSLGQGLKEFKDSISGDSQDQDQQRPALGAPASTQPAPPVARTPAEAAVPTAPSPAEQPQTQAPPSAAVPPRPESAEVGSSEQRS